MSRHWQGRECRKPASLHPWAVTILTPGLPAFHVPKPLGFAVMGKQVSSKRKELCWGQEGARVQGSPGQ